MKIKPAALAACCIFLAAQLQAQNDIERMIAEIEDPSDHVRKVATNERAQLAAADSSPFALGAKLRLDLFS